MVAGKGWGDFFRGRKGGGCSFYIKNKLKSEIFNDKKGLETKMFLSVVTKNLNWAISTKSLVTFKRWDGVKAKKKGEVVFLRVEGEVIDTPMHNMHLAITLTVMLIS